MTAPLHPRDRRAAIVLAMTGPEGLLRRYRPSTHLDDTLRAAEARDLIDDLDAALPTDLTADGLATHLDGARRALRRAWGGPWWPTSVMLVEAAQEATEAASRAGGADAGEHPALGWLASFFAAHGRPLPGVATPERTAALIRRGTLTAREARHAGFPLTDADDAAARRQPPCAAEIASAIRCRARLRGITEAAARAELVAAGEIPGRQMRGAAA
jgi:hypothetical protein